MKLIHLFYFFLISTLTFLIGGNALEDAGLMNERKNIYWKILDGHLARDGDFPFTVYIQSDNRKVGVYCGGSIITKNHVLTAAHCIHSDLPLITLYFGSVLHKHPLVTRQTTKDNAIVHPRYHGINGEGSPNDIAIIYFSKPLQFNGMINVNKTAKLIIAQIQPVRLGSYKHPKNLDYADATVAGWGKVANGAPEGSPNLKFANVYIYPHKECRNIFPRSIFGNKQICVGHTDGSVCQGDSGGPLLVKDNDGKMSQIGIVSFGLMKCDDDPQVYTFVPSFKKWIKSVTKSKL